MSNGDMFKIVQVRFLIHDAEMSQYSSALSAGGIDDFYSNACMNMLFYGAYIAKADGTADEDEIADILEIYSKTPELQKIVKDTYKDILDYDFETIKAYLWDQTDDFAGKLALLVHIGTAKMSSIESIIKFYSDFADLIIASDGVVDKAELRAKADFEDKFYAVFNFYNERLGR